MCRTPRLHRRANRQIIAVSSHFLANNPQVLIIQIQIHFTQIISVSSPKTDNTNTNLQIKMRNGMLIVFAKPSAAKAYKIFVATSGLGNFSFCHNFFRKHCEKYIPSNLHTFCVISYTTSVNLGTCCENLK